jgi:hypothetical protein
VEGVFESGISGPVAVHLGASGALEDPAWRLWCLLFVLSRHGEEGYYFLIAGGLYFLIVGGLLFGK